MKRIFLFLVVLSLTFTSSFAINARQVLDKTMSVLSNKGGVSTKFTIQGGAYGNTSGTIAVKGRKFRVVTPIATVWFDGKTQWTYMKRSNEVNVNTPSEGELQTINPYNFINLYQSGYSMSLSVVGGYYKVHLIATDNKKQVQEMYIIVGKSNYVPSQVRMKQRGKWSTINISGFKSSNISDATFRFNSKNFPSAEIIDLR